MLSEGRPNTNEKIKNSEYIKVSFRGGQNTIKLVTLNNKIVIPQLLQIYVLKWYHTYILHIGKDRTEEIIFQTFLLAHNWK